MDTSCAGRWCEPDFVFAIRIVFGYGTGDIDEVSLVAYELRLVSESNNFR